MGFPLDLEPRTTHDGHAIHWALRQDTNDRALCGAEAPYDIPYNGQVYATCKRCIASNARRSEKERG